MKKAMAGCLTVALPGWAACSTPGPFSPVRIFAPRRALVLWYSQTGHTSRIGRVIGQKLQQFGLTVDTVDYRDLQASALNRYEIIVLGSPVHYADVPVNLRDWLRDVPPLDGIPVAAYVTYGGKGDGQHNTACRLLEAMTQRGGAPVGMDTFGNMSTFAPTWSIGNEKRILLFKDRPNEATYAQARAFAGELIDRVRTGNIFEINREFGLGSMVSWFPQRWFTRLLIGDHYIDQGLCIECGLCEAKCPVGAIELHDKTIDRARCIVCIGCVNNCPEQAVRMTFMGKDVYGFQTFLKRHRIIIQEPEVLGPKSVAP